MSTPKLPICIYLITFKYLYVNLWRCAKKYLDVFTYDYINANKDHQKNIKQPF